MISYKKLEKEFERRGINSYTFKKNKIISQGVWTKIKSGKDLNLSTINSICAFLNCQPGDILEYIPDESNENASEK